ncbi:MAG: ATP-binding protein [Armatimonadetes bacterium]|jgi:serine/threonine-protein kinase RsbW|nr:ATP-binding protein [Armatimonadota bacterium]
MMTSDNHGDSNGQPPAAERPGGACTAARCVRRTPGRRDLALVVPGETDYLQLVRDFVTAIARKMGFPDHRVGEIEIAVDEACANIIEHAYGNASLRERVIVAHHGDRGAEAITLRVSIYGDRIELRIFDRGPRFSVEELESLDLAEVVGSGRARGIGSYIIRSFMDEVRHTYHPGEGNELTLIKYLG